MSLLRRRRAVDAAEARAAACIERARERIAASRADRESPAYPLTLGLVGLGLGVAAEHVVSPNQEGAPRVPAPGDATREEAPGGWWRLANAGLALRWWQQLRPLLDALGGSGGQHQAGSAPPADGQADGGQVGHAEP